MSFKSNTLFKKALILFAFSIILLIPLFFIANIIEDRNDLFSKSSQEIGNSWGKAQSIAGPVISIPYTVGILEDEYVKNSSGQDIKVTRKSYDHRTAFITPEVYTATIDIKDSVRNRGIFKSIVYTADINLSGHFNISDIQKSDQNKIDGVTWHKSEISLGITDPRAIVNIKEFKLGDDNITLGAGTEYHIKEFAKFNNGASSDINLKGAVTKLPFTVKMEVRGSNDFSIIPIGDSNDINIKSTWKDPSFKGNLPASREISDSGFNANWSITNLVANNNKDLAMRVGNNYNSYDYEMSEGSGSFITVDFYQGVTHYRQVIRATKYAYLFIALSLLVLFIFEVVGRRSIHFLQYAIISVSLAVFYLVLLALSEHITFLIAYLISTLAIVLPITLYTISFLKNKRYGLGICGTLTGLYLVLLSILQLEDYALLTGTGLILVTLYALMYLTRHLRAENNEKDFSK